MKFDEILTKLISGDSLDEDTAYAVMTRVMSGELTDAQIAGFLVALRVKGESVEEIVGCARAMRDAALPLNVEGLDTVDTCGTGGDKSGTFNVSTAAALIAAGAGLKVAKHGNRSVSSGSGSADVLEALGVKIDAPPAVVEKCIRAAGMGFLFAPVFHQAMKHAIGPRRQLGVRTIFNVLGPLTNPARARRQVIGLFSRDMLELIAEVVLRLGLQRAWVLHSEDGLDEISVCAPTEVAEVAGGRIRRFKIRPEDFKLKHDSLAALKVASPAESAEMLRSVLSGTAGPALDISLLNAAAVITVAGIADDLAFALQTARKAVESGKARAALEKLVEVSNSPD